MQTLVLTMHLLLLQVLQPASQTSCVEMQVLSIRGHRPCCKDTGSYLTLAECRSQ